MDTFTFVCLTEKQVATAVDVQVLADGEYRRHALQLMREHASAVAVEVWSGEAVIATIDRNGLWPRAARRRTIWRLEVEGQARKVRRTTPAPTSTTPSQFVGDSFSPRNATPKTATRMTLSLSTGATRAASPSFKALK